MAIEDEVAINCGNVENTLLKSFLTNAMTGNIGEIKVNDLLVESIIDQFKQDGQDLSFESALIVYHLISIAPFPFLSSNLHKLFVTALVRMLSCCDTRIKLYATKSLAMLMEKQDFCSDPLVKYKLDELFLQSLFTNYCDKRVEYMAESFECVRLVITKCNQKHSERYLKLFDDFCKSYFMSVLLIPPERANEFKVATLSVGFGLVHELNVATVLYFDDLLMVIDICLARESVDEAFALLHKIISLTWPVLKHNLNSVVRILFEHATRYEEIPIWLKEGFVKTIRMLITCLDRDSIKIVYDTAVKASGERSAFLAEWFPID